MAHGVIEDVGGEIGYTATTTLVTWFGGSGLYVPTIVDETHLLARLIGLPAFRRLVAAFPSESIRIPKPVNQADDRARRVARMLIAGRTEREIAEEIGISVRRVEQIRKRLVDEGILAALAQSAKCGAN